VLTIENEWVNLKGISKNSAYPSLLEKGDGLRPLKTGFLEMPLNY
jgi:hypothetical protein